MDRKFLEAISCLDPIGFIGIAKILQVEILDKQFTDVLANVMEKYSKLNRRQKRNLFKIVRAATSK